MEKEMWETSMNCAAGFPDKHSECPRYPIPPWNGLAMVAYV